MGSTSGMLVITFLPQIASARAMCSCAVPNRLSTLAAAKEKMGNMLCSFASASITGNTLSYVQNEPHKQNPIFII
jgi:hypothetical protein